MWNTQSSPVPPLISVGCLIALSTMSSPLMSLRWTSLTSHNDVISCCMRLFTSSLLLLFRTWCFPCRSVFLHSFHVTQPWKNTDSLLLTSFLTSFDTMSFQEMHRILLCHQWWDASRRLLFVFVTLRDFLAFCKELSKSWVQVGMVSLCFQALAVTIYHN